MKKSSLITTAVAVAASVATPVLAATTSVDLGQYVRVGRHALPDPSNTTAPANNLLAQEASGVAYNYDTDTLFIIGDGSRSITQVSKTGQLIDTMNLALQAGAPQGTVFYDSEGITYIGNNQFVFTEERDREATRLTYAAGTTAGAVEASTIKLGTSIGNVGLEGLSYDPATNGYIFVKEQVPLGVFQSTLDFNTLTASNGSPSTENSVNLFTPSFAGLSDLADVFALSNLPSLAGGGEFGNLLLISQVDAAIVEVDRDGNVLSRLDITGDLGDTLSMADMQHEGLTMDRAGNLYIVNENGGGDINHPELWVYAQVPEPTALALLIPGALGLMARRRR